MFMISPWLAPVGSDRTTAGPAPSIRAGLNLTRFDYVLIAVADEAAFAAEYIDIQSEYD
jgi:hypothetical protein